MSNHISRRRFIGSTTALALGSLQIVTEEEVASTARDYLASWSPEEIFRLPKDCRPRRIRDGEDINTYAFQLTRARFNRAPDVDEDLLEKMMVFFTHAATRIAQLQA